MIYTPSVQTTFLPKNNQLDFHERGAVRAAKGRVFGTKPGGPPAPEPEFDPPIVKDKAQWHIDNKYEVGLEVSAFAATWREGNPETQTYRSRWQTRATSSDAWTNSAWINDPTNQQVRLTFTPTEPGELRFQSQVRDTTWDPVAQVNSFAAIQNVAAPATEIGDVSLTVNDVLHEDGGAITLLINDPVPAEIFFTGDANPTFKWEARSNYPLMVGQQAKSTVLTFPEAGGPTVTCTLTDSTATDSPISYGVNFYIVDAKTYEELKSNNKL